MGEINIPGVKLVGDSEGKVIAWPNGATLFIGPPPNEWVDEKLPADIIGALIVQQDSKSAPMAFALNETELRVLVIEAGRLLDLGT